MCTIAKKALFLLVCLCHFIVGTNAVTQLNSSVDGNTLFNLSYMAKSQQRTDDISKALDSYFDCIYECRANLNTNTYSNAGFYDRDDTEAAEFYEKDIALMQSLTDNLLCYGDALKYSSYTIKKDYSISDVDDCYAKAIVSIECEFSYVGSPEIDSASWLLYEVQLKNTNNYWEVVSRSYPEFAETTPVIANACKDVNNCPDSSIISDAKEEENVRLLHLYNRSLAAGNAVNYVEPTGTSGGHYVYSYPNGYYDAYSADCTNFVSFCMNYGGGIPQDTSGNHKWWSSSSYLVCSSSWVNVDDFYDYLVDGDEGVANGGIVAGCIYSGASYPSSTVLSGLKLGDIVQFSSAGGGDDWTHSAIVSTISTSTGPHICNHSVASAYRNRALSEFYSYYAAQNTSYYIRLISILGYH